MFFKPFLAPEPPKFQNKSYNVLDFGVEDGDITGALKEAISVCSEGGGGRVVIPKGEWKSGPIHFKDNVEIHFEEGSYLSFSKNFNDYLPVVFGILAGNRVYSVSHFIYAYRCKNIALTGKGVLNGNGEVWWPMKHHQPGMEDLVKKGKAGAKKRSENTDRKCFR